MMFKGFRLVVMLWVCSAITGCIADNCTAVQCLNEGVCVQGTCACMQGYEGQYCQGRWYEKFAGQWAAVEKENKNTVRDYTLQLVPGSGPDSFYILQLAQLADSVLCTRKSYNVFSLHERALPDSAKVQGGEGIYDETTGTVTGVYSIARNEVVTNLSFTWSR